MGPRPGAHGSQEDKFKTRRGKASQRDPGRKIGWMLSHVSRLVTEQKKPIDKEQYGQYLIKFITTIINSEEMIANY